MPSQKIILRHLGVCEYQSIWHDMRAFTAARAETTPDELWLLEHPPVFTQGLNGRPEHLLAPGDIPVLQVDRGGQITYHSPGQLVVYVLIDLARRSWGVRHLVNALEQSVIGLLAEYGIAGYTKARAPGVYVATKKIAFLGLRVRRGRSYHGLSLNVNMDLTPFSRINPCGYPGLAVTQLFDLGVSGDFKDIAESFAQRLRHNIEHSTIRHETPSPAPKKDNSVTHQRGAAKLKPKLTQGSATIAATTPVMRKPKWIRARSADNAQVVRLKKILRDRKLHTVCEEASCPNLGECFGQGTATFLIMGDICTRRCPFCDVAHGRPNPLDHHEPENLARTIKSMGLNYVVVTSVDRDDLRDGGAEHYVVCIKAIRKHSPGTRIEILVPDFRGRMEIALDILRAAPPDVFNHNLETVPHLYRKVRPGADYHRSLQLIKQFKEQHPGIPTKSGVMLGLGESSDEIIQVLADLRDHDCDMLTIGQYLQPSRHHLPVARYVVPAEFDRLAQLATDMGFRHVASGPMVRSSYHAEQQAAGEKVD